MARCYPSREFCPIFGYLGNLLLFPQELTQELTIKSGTNIYTKISQELIQLLKPFSEILSYEHCCCWVPLARVQKLFSALPTPFSSSRQISFFCGSCCWFKNWKLFKVKFINYHKVLEKISIGRRRRKRKRKNCFKFKNTVWVKLMIEIFLKRLFSKISQGVNPGSIEGKMSHLTTQSHSPR